MSRYSDASMGSRQKTIVMKFFISVGLWGLGYIGGRLFGNNYRINKPSFYSAFPTEELMAIPSIAANASSETRIHAVLQDHVVSSHQVVVNNNSTVNNTQHHQYVHSSWSPNSEPLHVLYTLAGDNEGFFGEFTTSFKASLLHSPLDRQMVVHILTDQKAFATVKIIMEKIEIDQWRTRNRLIIHVYNVENKTDQFKAIIKNATKRNHKQVHTIGAFYRLFAASIVPKSVSHAVYMDTDAVMLTNLEEIWNFRNESLLFQWGQSECSGFVLMNIRLWREKFWELNYHVHHLPKEKFGGVVGDQSQLRKVAKYNRDIVGYLPKDWDNHLANGMWNSCKNMKRCVENKPRIGYAHFNGGSGSKKNAFASDDGFTTYKMWRVTKYYAFHPFEWIRYQLETQVRIGHPGHQVVINYIQVH